MFKFDNDTIFAGYIKQLLASFNLPMYRVYTKENQKYFNTYGKESPEIITTIKRDDKNINTLTRYVPYIKDGDICEFLNDAKTWHKIGTYFKNRKIANYTKNLKIKNNIYDTYTHEYLGNYLRFLRDYDDIDLMPLYNCFSNKLCTNILLECDHTDSTGKVINHFSFNSMDTHYKIFIFPVKLFKKYTIAIDCNSPVEICCGVYGKYQDPDELFEGVAHDTYKNYGQLTFNQPILYDKLLNLNTYLTEENLTRLAIKENDLKMFIKLPASNKSTIVVLEGDYTNWNDTILKQQDYKKQDGTTTYTNYLLYKNNYVVNMYDEKNKKIISDFDFATKREFKPIGKLQLLETNTNESYPFSDKLVEYLTDNVITHIDELEDNIERVQRAIEKRTNYKICPLTKDSYGIWDSRIRPLIYENAQQQKIVKITTDETDPTINYYTFSNEGSSDAKIDRLYDNLGYVDNDAESTYVYYETIKDKQIPTSISSIDIYNDLYNKHGGK